MITNRENPPKQNIFSAIAEISFACISVGYFIVGTMVVKAEEDPQKFLSQTLQVASAPEYLASSAKNNVGELLKNNLFNQ